MPRLKRNIGLLLVNLLLLLAGVLVLPYLALWERVSVASAWLCMLLLIVVLLIAPLQRLQGRQPPLNIYLRRDLGCWAATQIACASMASVLSRSKKALTCWAGSSLAWCPSELIVLAQ